jgi:segregation and condensation protein B
MVAGGYRLLTRPVFSPWLDRLGHLPPAVKLSSPMMETLAVVAYRQEVSRADIEAVRGVGCGEILRQLMDRDLIRIAGRSEELGRPYLYGTTKRFLQLFGLSNLNALPPIEWETLRDDPPAEDSSSDDSSTSKKESVVSTTVEPVMSENDFGPVSAPSSSATALDSAEVLAATTDQHGPSSQSHASPQSVIEDEEDEIYGDADDDEDEYDDDYDDDDWDDEEDEDEFEDEEDDYLDDDDEDDEAWEEVDDEDSEEDLDDEDDWDEDDEGDGEEDWDEEDEEDWE